MEKYNVSSNSQQDTTELAKSIGKKLKGGEVIELIGDLGSGKTTFVAGLAHGAGYKESVSSPSFVIHNQYKCPKLTIHHLDFYRLSDPGLIKDMLSEILSDDSNVVVIEWPGLIKDILPRSRVKINFKATSENQRQLDIEMPSSISYLLPK